MQMSVAGIKPDDKKTGNEAEQGEPQEDEVSWLNQRASKSPGLLPLGFGVLLLDSEILRSIHFWFLLFLLCSAGCGWRHI
jgi:hypothetical protein